mmetsp:Transcript_17784/g.35788  ORF Transcript_17784/g.35788 Transcript_17784/m.35788 type:complete len:482 (+) Transcript_17784:322-1767(+)
MKLSISYALMALLSADGACAFTIPRPSCTTARTTALRMAAAGEFDHILGEGATAATSVVSKSGGTGASRKSILRVPDSSDAITLTSSVAADPSASSDDQFFDAQESIDGVGVDDPFAEPTTEGGEAVAGDPRVQELVRQKQQRLAEGRFKFEPMKIIEGKDFTDLFFTVFVPLGLGLYGARWAFGKSTDYLAESAEDKLEDYANEMVYHEGDFEEMQMCHSDYKKKLSWLGPGKKDRMIKAYLEAFAKKISVSPKSISSLSYVFSLYKLSEDKAAKTLADICLEMPERTASNQKLLFFGNHILKSPEARAKLQPIRDMLTESYRDDVGVSGEEILEKSQQAMGEAAYRAAITAAGKKQSKLTPGWEVLGLDKETATQIFDEEKESGFISSKEAKYGRTSAKYDEKGRRLDKEGKVEDDNGVGEDDDDTDDAPTSNVYECGECGYTIFVAEGRTHKFFGAGFKCPECGAEKDQFVGRNAGED